MGDYYEVYANFDLDETTQKESLPVLEAIERGDEQWLMDNGYPSTWAHMFRFGAYYHARTEVCKLFRGAPGRPGLLGGACSFIGKGDTRTYNEEDILAFFEWLEDAADGFDGEFLGYYMHDQFKEDPKFMFRKTKSPEWRKER